MGWLRDEPMATVRACLAMLPRLQAEESLRAVDRLLVGTGSARVSDRRATVRRWKSAAGQGTRTARVASPLALAGFGIGYREVKAGV